MLVCVFAKCASLHMRPRVQRAPGFPCALWFQRDEDHAATLGHNSVARTQTHIQSSSPGLVRNCALGPGDPVFQGVGNGIEKLQRTGYSAFAEYDGPVWGSRSPHGEE